MTHFARPLPPFWAGSKTSSSAVAVAESQSAATPARPTASAAVSLTVALRYMAARRTRETIAAALEPALHGL